jgi:hypothetical protein
MKGFVSEEALAEYSRLAAEKLGVDFAEGDTYDFTRCMRPDGTFYGTRGKCKKGSEAGAAPAKEKSAKPVTRDEKVGALREKVAALKGSGDKKKLAEARGDLQGQERMRKIEAQAKKEGKPVDQVIRERNEAADKKIKERIRAEYPNMVSPAKEGAAKRKLATSEEARAVWKETEKAVKSAKAEYARVKSETKGDKSPEANKRRLAAGAALDKAERLALKASDKFGAASRRESKAAMTPEQRKQEREWQKTKKLLG